jgi:LmbE family N-acetylglucosaminyl deacetylase
MKYKSVLAIGAHPDDVEFSCLGFLMQLRAEGTSVNVYIASSGSVGDPSSGPIRLAESRAALSCIDGVTIFANEEAGVLESSYEEISSDIRRIILEAKPDLILVHDHNDTHQEHRVLHDILVTAARRCPVSIFTYKSVSVTASFKENVFVDVSKYLERKISAINMHFSQAGSEYMTREYIVSYHENWFAKIHGLGAVESYCVEQLIVK